MPKPNDLVDFTPDSASGDMELGSSKLLHSAAASSSAGDFDLKEIGSASTSGLDSFFAQNPDVVKPLKMASGRKKVAGLGDLSNFIRLSNETLINKSDRDLWSIKKDADGGLLIERMFDDDGNPLKG